VHQTHLKPPTVSVTLKRLEDEGLVRRAQDTGDMRVVRVFLSEAGRAHNKSVRERLKCIDATLMEGFSEAETACLLQFLERMRDNILPDYMKKNT
jgi:DNA-binding MarR family transcriptional regulator